MRNPRDTSSQHTYNSAQQLTDGPDSPIQTINAGREVIVSAGTLNSPKILQLSGIGPSSVLSKYGIETMVDLPGVGANLQDHPYGITLASCENPSPALKQCRARLIISCSARRYSRERRSGQRDF